MRTVAVIGPSGSGKSTLLRIIAGLEVPDGGSLSLDGQTVQFNEKYLLPYRRRIGVVFQSFNLFPHLTALQNINFKNPAEQPKPDITDMPQHDFRPK